MRQNVEEMLEIVTIVIEKVMNLVKSLPLNNLLVGVVVPIAAAWISYYLAERAISSPRGCKDPQRFPEPVSLQ